MTNGIMMPVGMTGVNTTDRDMTPVEGTRRVCTIGCMTWPAFLSLDTVRMGFSIPGFTPAELVWDIQETHQNGVVLIYRGCVYIFSRDNQLITVYRNQRISL